MSIEVLTLDTDAEWLAARKRDVTASVVASLFGIHEFVTPYALWAEKSGRKRTDNILNEAINRGRLMEPVAVNVLSQDFPEWDIVHNTGEGVKYFRDPEKRLGATPDMFVNCPLRGEGIVQVKSVEASLFRRKWCANGEPEPPLWIAVQAAVEAALTDSCWAAVAPIVVSHGIEVPLIEIPLSEKVVESVYQKVADFWLTIERGIEPDPDFSLDGDTIDQLYAGDGTEIDLSGSDVVFELVREHGLVFEKLTDAQERLAEIKAELKYAMKGSEFAYLRHGKRMTWRTQRRRFSDGTTKSHRVLRVPKIDTDIVSSGDSARPDETKEVEKTVYNRFKF